MLVVYLEFIVLMCTVVRRKQPEMVGWSLRSAIFILFPPPLRPLSLNCSKYTLPFPIPHVLRASLRHLRVFKCLQVTLAVLKAKLFEE